MKNQAHFLIAIFIFAAFSLVGCSSTPATQSSHPNTKVAAHKPLFKGSTKDRLNKHFKSWQGTPYKYGGLNKRGIDCSGFIYVTYRDVFGQKLPRSTELLAGIGKEIPKNKLKIGDLVFFKTGIPIRMSMNTNSTMQIT